MPLDVIARVVLAGAVCRANASAVEDLRAGGDVQHIAFVNQGEVVGCVIVIVFIPVRRVVGELVLPVMADGQFDLPRQLDFCTQAPLVGFDYLMWVGVYWVRVSVSPVLRRIGLELGQGQRVHITNIDARA